MDGFVTEPEVVLVGKPIMCPEGVRRFLEEHQYFWPELENKLGSAMDLGDSDGEWLIEMAGRNCYQSWPKDGESAKGRLHEDHIKNLIESKHGACLEHCNFNFLIWNVSRTLTHELVRHRLASFSQLSQRYVDSSNVSFIIPPAIQELAKIDLDAYNEWMTHCERSRQLYENLTAKLSRMYQDVPSGLERRKMARQAARSVLPNATETKIFVTMNVRAIRHLIELRANPAADIEIRALAVKVYKILEKEMPVFLHGMKIIDLPDGTKGVESDFKRV